MDAFHYTGNPFVDAGIAGLCAAAGAAGVDQLDTPSLEKAVTQLVDLLTSDAAFRPRLVGKKQTIFATSEMSIVFPNSPLAQPGTPRNQTPNQVKENKKQRYMERVRQKYNAFLSGEQEQRSAASDCCFVTGAPAVGYLGNDEFPLVDSKSKTNFHPGHRPGHPVGSTATFALEFLPFSILRTGQNSGLFWFVHTANEEIAVRCAQLTLKHMTQCIARNDGLGFYGQWNIPSRDTDASFVALIQDLTQGTGQNALSSKRIRQGWYPVTAYVFSNDNRSASIKAHDLPHQLFLYFIQLHARRSALDRFSRDVLRNERIGPHVAGLMLARCPIVASCVQRRSEVGQRYLAGGWLAHSLYVWEVLGMTSVFIRDIENISERVFCSEHVRDSVLSLEKDKIPVASALLGLNRRGLINFEEFTRLVPPQDRSAPHSVRDYLLAAIYERQNASARGEAFEPWDGDEMDLEETKHPLIILTESVGRRLVHDPDAARRTATDLAKARRLSDLRGALLRSVRRGDMSWSDFADIFPPDKTWISYLMRDYLLAYLYTELRDPALPEAAAISSTTSESVGVIE